MIKVADAFRVSRCEDNYIHIELINNSDKVFAVLILNIESELELLMKDLFELCKPIRH